MQYRIILIIIWLITNCTLKAQSQKNNLDIIIEKLIENVAEENKQSLVLELHELSENPININSDDIQKLTDICILYPEVISNIKKYRKKHGDFISIYELKLVEGFNLNMLKLIYPFIFAESSSPIDTPRKQTKSRHDINWKSQITYKTPKEKNNYEGTPWKHSLRYKYLHNHKIEAGLLAEKDAGEEFFTGNQKKGFDFYSGYIQIKSNSKFKQINIGDFKANWGQGLISWNGLFSGKSAFSIVRGNSSQSIKRYNSTDENNFFRGISLQYNLFKYLIINPFISYKKRDAKIIKESYNDAEKPGNLSNINDTIILSDLVNTGFHRTLTESRNKHKATEKIYGCRLSLNNSAFSININYLNSYITPPIDQSNRYWQTYDLAGRKNENISIDYKFNLRKIYFFGESAISSNKAQAHIIGINLKATNSSELSLIYRNYEKDYQSLYAKGFGEFSDTRNEEGIYIGLEAFPLKKIKVNAYYDYFKFPYKRYCINIPGHGLEYLINTEYIISEKTNMYCKYKYEKKPKNLTLEKVTSVPYNIRQYLRYQINITPSENWEFRSRLEVSKYTHYEIKDKGYILFQDIFLNSLSSKIRTQFRFTYFNTESYNSRIYTYENDLLYSFYSPALFDKGYRTFINTRLKFSKKLALYCKYAYTKYLNDKTNTTEQRHKSEFKIQIRITL